MSEAGEAHADAVAREAATRPRSRSLAPLRRLTPYLARYPRVLLAALAALVLAAAATLTVPAAVREMVDHGFSRENASAIDQYFLLLFGVAAVLGFATAVRFFFVSWLGERVVADIRRDVYSHILTLSPVFFETTRTGEVLSRLTTDTTLIQNVVGSSISIALRNAVILVGGVAMMLLTAPGLAAAALVVVPAIVLPIIVVGRRVRLLSRANQDRVADTSAHAGETINAIQTIQAFTHEAADGARYAAAVEAAFAAARAKITVRAGMTALVIFLAFAGIVGVMWWGARLVLEDAMTAGELGQFILYAVIVAGSIGALSEVWGELQAAAGAAERLMELLATAPAIAAPPTPATLPAKVTGRVRFEGVTFQYPARPEVSALARFSLSVAPGERVALVGPSGAGKTTVFQLLQRFYDPQSGRITLDGLDIATLDPQDLRRQIAVVPQESVIFAGTVAQNIRFGRPDADDAAVRAAAEAAQAAAFIAALPQGYDTQIGERGVTISGGQRQRIAIARAILRNAPILLLDEATSALDAESERLVQQGLERLMAGRTTLVIAHRLATVLNADRIIVMQDGAVAATGTHHDLVAKNPLYARLAELQFAVPDALPATGTG